MASPRHSLRPDRALTWFVGLGIVAFIGVTLGPSLVGHNALLSLDRLTTLYPWMAHGSQAVGHQLCAGDTIDSQIPGTAFIRNQLFHGHLPNWQGLVAGGAPLGSQPNLGLLSPISLPFWLMPLWLAPAFIKLLEFVVAIGGTYLFLRRLGVRRAAGLLAGFTFAISGFMVMWTNWPQSEVAAYIPALFWATERLIQRARLSDAVWLAVIFAAMLLGGFPAVTGWALYAGGAYLILRLIVLHRHEIRQASRRIGLAVGGLILGAMLSAIQMLPFFETYTASDMSYRSGLGHTPLPFSGLLTLAVPDERGLCIGGKPVYGNVNPVELVAYIGSAALVLILVGVFAHSRTTQGRGSSVRTFFVAATLITIAIGWGTPVVLRYVDMLPVFSGNPVGRIRALLGFFLAVLVGFGFDALQRWRQERDTSVARDRHTGGNQILGLTVVVFFAAAVGFAAQRDASAIGYRHALLLMTRVPALYIAIALVCVGLIYLSKASRRISPAPVALTVLPVLAFIQGGVFFHTVLPGDTKKNFYPVTGAHQFLQANLGSDRFAATGGVLYPATSLFYGLRSATGHTFTEQRWSDLLSAVDSRVMGTPTYSDFDELLTPAQAGASDILNRMGVKYLVVAPTQLTGDFLPLPVNPATVAAAPGQTATCTLAPGAVRGITVQLAAALFATDPNKGVALDVAMSAGGTTVHSGKFLGPAVPANVNISIAVPESLPANQSVTVRIGATGGDAPLVLHAQAPGAAACAPVRPVEDGLKIVYADAGSIIYQRLSALPRIRWASATTVISSPVVRILALKEGLSPDDVVLDTPGPKAAGLPAKINVPSDTGGHFAADVDAAGAGYLVVADALQQPGWSATLDGKPVTMRPADHAMVAIAVPRGVHHVVMTYRAPGQLAGVVLTGIAILLLVGVGLAQRRGWWTPPAARRDIDDEHESLDDTCPAVST